MPPKRYVDVVVSRSEGDVLNTATAIFVVLAGHFRLRGALDGQSQASSACTPEQRVEGGDKGERERERMKGEKKK